MIRQTGGSALGATSTRSSSCSRAMCQRFGQGLDPELLSVGTDEEDLAGADAVVDPDLVCSYVVTCFVRGFLRGRNLGPDATMADTGMSAIKRPARDGGRATCGPGAPGAIGCWVLRGGRVGTAARMNARVPLPCSAGCDRISCQDTRVSSIWTPSGEHRPEAGAEPGRQLRRSRRPPERRRRSRLTQEQLPGAAREARAELADDPGRRHRRQPRHRALAAGGAPPHARSRRRRHSRSPDLDEAGLAIDALAALVDTLGDRLGPHDEAAPRGGDPAPARVRASSPHARSDAPR